MLHLKKSNAHYGYKGMQPQYIAACQLINPEVAPEKLKLAVKRVFAGVYAEDQTKCCPDCARIAELLPVQRLSDDQFHEMLCISTSIESVLYQHTKDLFKTLMDATTVKAGELFRFYEGIHAMKYEELVAKYPQKYISRYNGAESVILSKKGSRVRDEASRAMRQGRELFVAKFEDKARQHYISSTAKLADRLRAKGLDIAKYCLFIDCERIDMAGNISLTIRFDDQVVRAWTIIAGGPVQCDHFRYLVK